MNQTPFETARKMMVDCQIRPSKVTDQNVLDAFLTVPREAVVSKHQQVVLPREADALVNAGFYSMEMRRPGGGVSIIETVAYNGVAIAENGRMAAIRYVS